MTQQVQSAKIKPVDPRTFTACMEQLQEGYVYAVAATAGCVVQPVSRDVYGMDVMFVRSYEDTAREEVSVYAQLKNTTTIKPDPGKPDFRYRFSERKHMERLVATRKNLKAILVVMCTNPDQSQWTDGTHELLSVAHCCYWANLMGIEVPADRKKPSVRVPTANVFNAAALGAMLDRLEKGEEP